METETNEIENLIYSHQNKLYCPICQCMYEPDMRNYKRGWGRTCSKSCAAKLREAKKIKPMPETDDGLYNGRYLGHPYYFEN